jgi:hypothetical protein
VAINLGLALADAAVAPEVLRRAPEMGLGIWLPLWAPRSQPGLTAVRRY